MNGVKVGQWIARKFVSGRHAPECRWVSRWTIFERVVSVLYYYTATTTIAVYGRPVVLLDGTKWTTHNLFKSVSDWRTSTFKFALHSTHQCEMGGSWILNREYWAHHSWASWAHHSWLKTDLKLNHGISNTNIHSLFMDTVTLTVVPSEFVLSWNQSVHFH